MDDKPSFDLLHPTRQDIEIVDAVLPITNGPREGIGTWSGFRYEGGLPQEEILYRMEETEMDTDAEAIPRGTMGAGEEAGTEMNSYMREVLREKDIAPPFMAAGEVHRDPSAQSFHLKLRYPGMEGQSEWPDHSEMFHGFMDDDPSFIQGAPSFHSKGDRKAIAHTVVRARRMEPTMGDNAYAGPSESPWQDNLINRAKKDVQVRSSKLLNIWEWPMFTSFAVGVKGASQPNRDQMKYDIAAGSETIFAGKGARDEYGRIMRSRTGFKWYTLPWIEQGQEFHLESTRQPRGVIAENGTEATALLYSVADMDGIERMGNAPRNRWTEGNDRAREGVDQERTQEMGASIESRGYRSAPHKDETAARRQVTRTREEGDMVQRVWMNRARDAPAGDAVKMKYEGEVEALREGSISMRGPKGSYSKQDESKARGMAIAEMSGEDHGERGRASRFLNPMDRMGHDMDLVEHESHGDADIYRDYMRRSGDIPEDMSRIRRGVSMEDRAEVDMHAINRSTRGMTEPGLSHMLGEYEDMEHVEASRGAMSSTGLPSWMREGMVRRSDGVSLEEFRPPSTTSRTHSSFKPSTASRLYDRDALLP